MSTPEEKKPKPAKPSEEWSGGSGSDAGNLSSKGTQAEAGTVPEGEADEAVDGGEASSGETPPVAGAPFVAPTTEELAPHFPNLEIHEVIAAGGMGAVYRVRQPQLDRFVALKILPPESGAESEYVERFGREAKLMAQLNHPNIVGIYDFGNTGDLFYFIMEFVDGQTLHEAIQTAPVPANAARLLMLQISKGLKYAHDKGVLHLDIKPGNIMVNAEGVVKILDFGLANLVGQDDEEAFGTPYYTAPERYTAGMRFDHRADIFSLGAVFYEMLTQSPPQGEYHAASQIANSPPAYDAIINRCLQPSPERRYADAGALGADLAKVKNARAPVQLAKTSPVSVSRTGAGADYQKAYEDSQKKKAMTNLIIGIVAGIGVIVALFFIIAGGKDPDGGDGGNGGGNGKDKGKGNGGVVVVPPDPIDPIDPIGPGLPSGADVVVDRSPASETRLRADAYVDFPEAPRIAGRVVEVDALIETGPEDGVIVQQGGSQIGYSLYIQNGYLHFAVRISESGLTTLRAPETLSDKIVSVGGRVDGSGGMTLLVNGKTVAEGSAGSPLPEQPDFGVLVGKSGRFPVGEFPEQWSYDGHIQEVVIRTAPPTGGSGPFDGPFDR